MRPLWAVAILRAFYAEADVSLTSLYSFGVYTNGADPAAALVQGSDGNFYGTTFLGGTNGPYGTVFKVSPAGVLTTLHCFSGTDGANPFSGLVQGGDGNFYGTTYGGGVTNNYGGYGTVFKISPSGAFATLHSFTGGSDGANPKGSALVQGGDGNFYGGTGDNGPASNAGTVFKISASGVLTTLYSFTGGSDGAYYSALVQGTDGYFYGTTSGGGITNNYGGYGTVFKISPQGALVTLHSFTGSDGEGPNSLIQASDGNFYGTTGSGGTNGGFGTVFQGTVFQITSNGTFTSLHSFSDADGYNPIALLQGSDGNFYGTTQYGGTGGHGGTLFQMAPDGTFTILYSFAMGNNGTAPNGLVQGHDGNLYGTTRGSPVAEGETMLSAADLAAGTVFEFNTSGTFTTLYYFTGGFDGLSPLATLVEDDVGNLYGTTDGGGTAGDGTVFRVNTNGTGFASLYSFTGGNDGGNPVASLVLAGGVLYGTASLGGNSWNPLVSYAGSGAIFSLNTDGTGFTPLYTFTVSSQSDGWVNGDGAQPLDGLLLSGNTLYGTSSGGGSGGAGTVFAINSDGTGFAVLNNFTNTAGADPSAGLVLLSNTLYGTTSLWEGRRSGSVFAVNIDGTGFRTLHTFSATSGPSNSNADGASPGALVVSGNTLYGTCIDGGSSGNGTIFKITPSGAFATLHSFTGGSDGEDPNSLIQASDGYFYGTTQEGPGTIFKMSAGGAISTVYSFRGGTDGAQPRGGLMQGSDGNFYGTTLSGGLGGYGTVFRLTILPSPPLLLTPALTNGTLDITWTTEAGGTYQLQYTSDLSSTNWVNLGGPVVAGGTTLSTTDPATNATRQFYRVMRLP